MDRKIFTPFYLFRRKILKYRDEDARENFGISDKKDKDFGCFFVKIYWNFDENIRRGADRRRRRENLGILAISIAKFEKNLSDG